MAQVDDLPAVLTAHVNWLRGEGGARAFLRDADLRGADLTGAFLTDADLRGADLTGAFLTDADLPGANLRGADLTGADLRGAFLRGADLPGANLTGADLTDADLRGADLRDANLRNANLRGAIGYLCLGYDPRGYHFRAVKHANGWRISAGCRWFTVPEAVDHWTANGNRDALARVAIVEAA
jgi:hypothetical protein